MASAMAQETMMFSVSVAAIFFRVRSFSWIMYSATPKSRNMLARPVKTAATPSTPISFGVSSRAMITVLAKRSSKPR